MRPLQRAIVAQVRQHYDALGGALGMPAAEHAGANERSSRLDLDLRLLADVANGLLSRTHAELERVALALTRAQATLLANPLQAPVALSEGFWHTTAGILIARARWWVWADDLITISNAAALAFGANTQPNRMRIARAIDSGALDWTPDPSVANPQHNRRVLHSQVERLRDLRRLPDSNDY